MMPSVTPKSELLSVATRAILAARPASSPIRVRRRYLSIRFFAPVGALEQDERCPCAYAVVANTLSFSTLESRSRTKVAYLLTCRQGDKESGTPKRIVSVVRLLVFPISRLRLCLPTVCTERTSIVVSFVTPSQIDFPIWCSQHQFCRSSSSRSSRRARLISSSTCLPSHSPSPMSF